MMPSNVSAPQNFNESDNKYIQEPVRHTYIDLYLSIIVTVLMESLIESAEMLFSNAYALLNNISADYMFNEQRLMKGMSEEAEIDIR